VNLLRHPAAFFVCFGVFLAVAAGVYFVKVRPANAALGAAAADASEAAADAARLAPLAAGPNWKVGVDWFAAERRAKVEEFENGRVRAAGKLSTWFPGIVPEGAAKPARDEFQRAYAFHRDRLGNSVRDLIRKAGGPDVGETPIMKPAFLGGTPPKEEEMGRWQRLANVERIFLEAAAKTGAFAVRALEVESDTAALAAADPSYLRYRVRGAFAAPTRRLPALLDALIRAGDEAGGVGRLDGVTVEPGTFDLPRAAEDDPPLVAAVSLGFGFPIPAPVGASR
jgi:hypothetical protein